MHGRHRWETQDGRGRKQLVWRTPKSHPEPSAPSQPRGYRHRTAQPTQNRASVWRVWPPTCKRSATRPTPTHMHTRGMHTTMGFHEILEWAAVCCICSVAAATKAPAHMKGPRRPQWGAASCCRPPPTSGSMSRSPPRSGKRALHPQTSPNPTQSLPTMGRGTRRMLICGPRAHVAWLSNALLADSPRVS